MAKYSGKPNSSQLSKSVPGGLSEAFTAALADSSFDLTAFSYTTKYIKEKGEIVDEYQIVKAKKVFNNEKEPERLIDVKYEGVIS